MEMRRLLIPLLAAIVIVAGCAQNPPVDQSAYLAAQVQLASQSTLEINCPTGCSVAYTDPRDRNITIPKITTGYDAAIAISDRLIGAAVSVAPWYGVTKLGIEGIKGVRDARGPTHIGDVVGADKIGGNKHVGDYAGPVRGDTVGGDQYQGDRIENSGRITSPDDYTSEPTIVEQPAPIVVEQHTPVFQ